MGKYTLTGRNAEGEVIAQYKDYTFKEVKVFLESHRRMVNMAWYVTSIN